MKKLRTWALRIFSIVFIILWAFVSSSNNEPSSAVFTGDIHKDFLVVISIDALNAKDFEILKTLPNFKKLIEEGSYARKVTGVYPTLTYPSHTSLITGTYPDKHGIYNNKKNEVGIKNPDWYWSAKDIKVPTLYDLAKEKKMKVGALAWPVTAGANIDYNYPEIWTTNQGEDEETLIKDSGTPKFVALLRKVFGSNLKERKQPELDDFIANSAVYLIKNKTPELTLIHFTELDSKRHGYGVDAPIVKEVLKKQDTRVGKIIEAIKARGIYKNTTFVILGDHGFMNVSYKSNINVALKTAGLIETDSKGNITSWKAIIDACDGSAYVYLKDNEDMLTKQKVEALLNSYKNENKFGVEGVYDKQDIKAFRTNPNADFMLEAKEGYYFSNDWQGEEVIEKSKALGTHGYSPYKLNYNTLFLVSGAKAKKGAVLSNINIVDEGPTMAKFLNLSMDKVDGRVLNEFIR